MSTSTLPADTLALWINAGSDMAALGDHFEGVAPLPAIKPIVPSPVISAEIIAIEQIGIMRVFKTLGEDVIKLGEFETLADARSWLDARREGWILGGGLIDAFVIKCEIVQRIRRA